MSDIALASEPEWCEYPSPLAPHTKFPPTPKQRILQTIDEEARKRGLTGDDILGHSRKREVVDARHEIYAVLYLRWYSKNERSYPWLARILKRDHTSVIHGVKRGLKRLTLQNPHTTTV